MSPEISSYSDTISSDELFCHISTVVELLLFNVSFCVFVVSVNFLKVTDLAYFLYNGYMQKCHNC